MESKYDDIQYCKYLEGPCQVDGRIPAPPHAIVKPNGKLDVIEYISISLHQQPSDPDSVFCKGGC